MLSTFIEKLLCARFVKSTGHAKSIKTWTLLKSVRLDCNHFEGRNLVRIKDSNMIKLRYNSFIIKYMWAEASTNGFIEYSWRERI